MKFPISWIAEYTQLPTDDEAVAQAFTLSGSEVETIESVGGETIFDFGITVNRPDCMNVFGLAREASVLFNGKLKHPESSCLESGPPVEELASITVEAPELCPRYSARIITGARVGESPAWIRKRLEQCGLRPINGVVDITNYLLMELGHPLHAFDIDRLKEGRIVVRRAINGETITTLDGVGRKLDRERLVIADARGPVALAGVMGGEETGVTEATRNILLEAAVFDPVNIRRTGKAMGLDTDASHRFERGVDPMGPEVSLNRAARLILEISGGTLAEGVIDIRAPKAPTAPILLRHARISSLIGMEIPEERCRSILEALGFGVEENSPGRWLVTSPSFRVDVDREVDLIEEIIRIHGLADLVASLPPCIDPVGGKPTEEIFEERLRDFAAASGYFEAIHMSMTSPNLEETFGVACGAVALSNPLSPETSVLRTSLLGPLCATVGFNRSRGARTVRLFETGRVFLPEAGGVIKERAAFAAVCYVDDPPVVWGERVDVSLLHLKGLVTSFFERAGIDGVFVVENHPPFVEGLSMAVLLNGKKIGWIGTLGPKAMAVTGLKSGVAHGVELSLEGLGAAAREPSFKSLSRFPAMARDLSFLVGKEVAWGGIMAKVKELGLPNLEAVKLVEVYKGRGIPGEKKSVTFSLVFRSHEKTLSEEDVVPLLEEVESAMKKVFSALRR